MIEKEAWYLALKANESIEEAEASEEYYNRFSTPLQQQTQVCFDRGALLSRVVSPILDSIVGDHNFMPVFLAFQNLFLSLRDLETALRSQHQKKLSARPRKKKYPAPIPYNPKALSGVLYSMERYADTCIQMTQNFPVLPVAEKALKQVHESALQLKNESIKLFQVLDAEGRSYLH